MGGEEEEEKGKRKERGRRARLPPFPFSSSSSPPSHSFIYQGRGLEAWGMGGSSPKLREGQPAERTSKVELKVSTPRAGANFWTSYRENSFVFLSNNVMICMFAQNSDRKSQKRVS